MKDEVLTPFNVDLILTGLPMKSAAKTSTKPHPPTEARSIHHPSAELLAAARAARTDRDGAL